MARVHHLPALARLPEVSVAVLADPLPAALAAGRRPAPAASAVADWRDAVAMPGVDAALVCLPNGLHADAVEAAAGHGVHVYVEKPLATNLADADRAIAACRAAGTVGMVGFNYRFNALYADARRRLQGGEVGSVVAVRTVFSLARGEIADWKRARSEGGGVLLDLGSHHVDLVRWLLDDEVVEVNASLRSRSSEDDTAVVELRLASGPSVQSLFAYGTVDEERFEVYGEAGRLVVDRRRHERAVVERAGEGRLRRAGRLLHDGAHVGYVAEKRRFPGREPSHLAALRRFAAAVSTGTSVTPDLLDGRACLAVLEGAVRAAASVRPEPLTPAPQPATGAAR